MTCGLLADQARYEAGVSPIIVDRQTPLEITEDEFKAWAHLKGVFVSSTLTDMREEREAVRAVVEGIGARPIMWELIAPSDTEPGEAYKAGVRQADIHVLVLKRRYGTRLRSGYSASEEEYEEARENAKPILIRINDEIDMSEREGRLNRWIAELQQFHSTGVYTSPHDLAAQLTASLRNLAVSESTAWAKLNDAAFPYLRFSESPGGGWDAPILLDLVFRTRDRDVERHIDDILESQWVQRHSAEQHKAGPWERDRILGPVRREDLPTPRRRSDIVVRLPWW